MLQRSAAIAAAATSTAPHVLEVALAAGGGTSKEIGTGVLQRVGGDRGSSGVGGELRLRVSWAR